MMKSTQSICGLNFSFKTKKIFLEIIKYNVVFLPFYLITGPFLSDCAVVINSIIFLLLVKKKDFEEYKKNKYIIIFLIFWIYICLLSIFNNSNFDSIKIAFFYLRFGLFFLSTYFILKLDRNYDLLKKLYIIFTLCFLILSVDGFIQYFTGKNIIGYNLADGPRVSSFFGEELILGSYVSRLFPLYFGLSIFLYKHNLKKIVFSSIIFILLEVLVFLSGERSSFFFMNLSAFFMIVCINDFRLLRLVTYIVSVSIIFLILMFNPTAKDRIIVKTFDQMNLKIGTDNKELSENKIYIFSKEHHDYYISSLKMFKLNPFFGVGIKNFRNFCDDERYSTKNKLCNTHPHNNYIQLLAETGIIGFIIIFYLLINFFRLTIKHLLKKIKKKFLFNSFEICVLSGVLITLWPFVPTGNIFNNWLNIIYYMPLGFLLWSIKMKKLNESKLKSKS